IVQYMIQNSLGKLYDSFYPNNNLYQKWEYYLKSEINPIGTHKKFEIEKLRIIDPACGSGHILIYAFDLLFEMYQEAGYVVSEIPTLILKNNLYGIDIDKRSTQIATIALWIKA